MPDFILHSMVLTPKGRGYFRGVLHQRGRADRALVSLCDEPQPEPPDMPALYAFPPEFVIMMPSFQELEYMGAIKPTTPV